MDLSNLSSDLPLTKPVSQASINELNEELNTEFKKAAKSVASLYNSSSAGNAPSNSHKAEFANAAKSVAALYRLSNNSNKLLYYSGYLECLDNLLEVLTNGEDIENWALTKRAEITNISNTGNTEQTISNYTSISTENKTTTPKEAKEDFHIPLDYEFSIKSDITPGYHFRPSFPPLSVTHTLKQRQSIPHKKKVESLIRKNNIQQNTEVSSDEHDSDLTEKESNFDSDSDLISLKKKLRSEKEISAKKRRKKNTGLIDN